MSTIVLSTDQSSTHQQQLCNSADLRFLQLPSLELGVIFENEPYDCSSDSTVSSSRDSGSSRSSFDSPTCDSRSSPKSKQLCASPKFKIIDNTSLCQNNSDEDNSLIRKVRIEGRTKGWEICQAAKANKALNFFCVTTQEPSANLSLLLESVKAMNDELMCPEGNKVGKMAFSCLNSMMAVVAYLPKVPSCQNSNENIVAPASCSAYSWLERVAKDALGKACFIENVHKFGGVQRVVNVVNGEEYATFYMELSETEVEAGITAKAVKRDFQRELFPKEEPVHINSNKNQFNLRRMAAIRKAKKARAMNTSQQQQQKPSPSTHSSLGNGRFIQC